MKKKYKEKIISKLGIEYDLDYPVVKNLLDALKDVQGISLSEIGYFLEDIDGEVYDLLFKLAILVSAVQFSKDWYLFRFVPEDIKEFIDSLKEKLQDITAQRQEIIDNLLNTIEIKGRKRKDANIDYYIYQVYRPLLNASENIIAKLNKIEKQKGLKKNEKKRLMQADLPLDKISNLN